MNEQDNRLTLQETEQLCEFFMDCKLSVLQENELRYVLSQIDYHSPLIDDVRKLMGIELSAFDKSVPGSQRINKRWRTKKIAYFSIAASIAIIVCLGVGFLHHTTPDFTSTPGHTSPTPEYIAYVDGQQLSEDEARLQIEKEIRAADDFIREMSELEVSKQQIIDNFLNP